MALRRCDGFKRYALSIQYHGGSFLGFPFLGHHNEDCVLKDGTDLRGFRTIESRLREALCDCFGPDNWENIQVSSRTDRGVHAIRNTLHVDIHQSAGQSTGSSSGDDKTSTAGDRTILKKLKRGINFHLSRQGCTWERSRDDDTLQPKKKRHKRRRQSSRRPEPSYTFLGQDNFARFSRMNEVRILNAAVAPDFMRNSDYALQHYSESEPELVDWNARFSATRRIYMYRILAYPSLPGPGGQDESVFDDDNVIIESQDEFAMPFEWDRSWRVRGIDYGDTSRMTNSGPLDIDAMKEAASFLQGSHDFSSFRAAKCQRKSSVVTMNEIQIHSQPYGCVSNWLTPMTPNTGLLGFGSDNDTDFDYDNNNNNNSRAQPTLVTIVISGNSFLYRQVRNMVGCLVEIGRRRLLPTDVVDILQAKDRSVAPSMAPAHGLYLVDVQHGDFNF